MNPRLLPIKLLVILSFSACAFGQTQSISVATYNIEHFQDNFLARGITAMRPNPLPRVPEVQALLESERRHNEEDNWEVAQVILDPKFNPDILCIQEGCDQANLEYFNRTILRNAYETVIVFPSNTDRNQHVGMMLKTGFKVVQRKEDYHKEKDTVPNDRNNVLFARGPAFVLVQSPTGYRFWVGTNHQKSKSDNSAEVTQWRNREAKRTHEIIKQLEQAGPSDVIFLGDINDEPGIQEYEIQGGGDTVANLVGPERNGLSLLTKPLADAGQISYFGYSRPDYRSLIDHAVVTRSMQNQIQEVKIFQNNFTAVASDHAPVLVRLRPDPAGQN